MTMLAFATLFLCPIAAGGEPPKPIDPAPEEVFQAASVFRDMLLGATGIEEIAFKLSPLEPIEGIWVPAGDTGGVALWTRSREVLAASVLRCGLDICDDNRAVMILRQSPRFWFSPGTWDVVAQTRPPMLANFYEDDRYVTDRAVTVASAGLAAAHFSLLGISIEEDSPLELL